MSEIKYFPVFMGLLSPEHREKIGPAIWEFLWFIARTTKEFRDGDENLGIVLGGKPIKFSEIANDLGISENTVKKHVSKLKEYHYIESKKAPYGYIYKVKNSKKFKRNRQTKNDPSEKERQIQNDLSDERDRYKMVERQIQNGLCNKDIKDIKKDDINHHRKKDDDMKPNPFLEYEKAFGILSPKLIDDINYWIDESQFQEPEAIICEAIKRSQKQAPRQPAKYIDSVLKNWHNMELFTIEAIKEYNEKFDSKVYTKKSKKKVSKEDFDLSDD